MNLKFLLLFLLVTFCGFAFSDEGGLTFRGGLFSFFSSHALEASGQDIERAIITIHGSERNAQTYFNSVAGLSKRLGVADKTLVVAPHFKLATDPLLSQEFFWDDEGWLRGDEALNSPLVSSFDVLDHVMDLLGRKDLFPRLKVVVLTGHSAGAQMIQRYAAGSGVNEKYKHLQFKFVVANPGSYLYLTDRRPLSPSIGCAYNTYKFGLEQLNGYMARSSLDQIKTQYTSKTLYYFLGEMDTRSDDIDQSCPAQSQGINRLERGRLYQAQLEQEFPQARHFLMTVPGVGHTQYGMYNSELGQKILFQEL